MRRVGRLNRWAILFVLEAAFEWGGRAAVAQELPATPDFFDGFDVDRVIEEAGHE